MEAAWRSRVALLLVYDQYHTKYWLYVDYYFDRTLMTLTYYNDRRGPVGTANSSSTLRQSARIGHSLHPWQWHEGVAYNVSSAVHELVLRVKHFLNEHLHIELIGLPFLKGDIVSMANACSQQVMQVEHTLGSQRENGKSWAPGAPRLARSVWHGL